MSVGTRGSTRRWHMSLIFGIFRGLCGPIKNWHMALYRCYTSLYRMLTCPNDRPTHGSMNDRWLYKCWLCRVAWLYKCWRGNWLDMWLGCTNNDMARSGYDIWLYGSDVVDDFVVDYAVTWKCLLGKWLGWWLCGDWTIWANHRVTRGPITGHHVERQIYPMLASPKNLFGTPEDSNPRRAVKGSNPLEFQTNFLD